MTQFTGLTAPFFEVYVPERWSSNVHNLPRMRNKGLLLALAVAAEAQSTHALTGLIREASTEVPSIMNHKRVEAQWIYWCRDAAAKKALATFLEKTPLNEQVIFELAAHDKHAVIGLAMHHQGLWAGLRLAPQALVDRKNLSQKLRQSWERQHLLELLKALGARGSFAGRRTTQSGARADPSRLRRASPNSV